MRKPDVDDERPTGLAKAKAVAEYLGTTEHYLTRLRYEKRGPRYVRMAGGRNIRYRWADVLAWVEESVTGGESESRR